MDEGIIYMNTFTKIFLEYICKEKSKINFWLLFDVLNYISIFLNQMTEHKKQLKFFFCFKIKNSLILLMKVVIM